MSEGTSAEDEGSAFGIGTTGSKDFKKDLREEIDNAREEIDEWAKVYGDKKPIRKIVRARLVE